MIDCKLDCKLLVTFKQLSLFAFYKYTVILKVFFSLSKRLRKFLLKNSSDKNIFKLDF